MSFLSEPADSSVGPSRASKLTFARDGVRFCASLRYARARLSLSSRIRILVPEPVLRLADRLKVQSAIGQSRRKIMVRCI